MSITNPVKVTAEVHFDTTHPVDFYTTHPENFDTTRITICPTQARVAGDVLNTIAFILTRENIHHLSQFRHFSYPIPAEVGIPVEGVVPVHKIHAAFILSSVIPGMDVEKLIATKKNFKGLRPEINFQYLIEAIQKFTDKVTEILKD